MRTNIYEVVVYEEKLHISNIHQAKRFVYEHQNIFAESTRRYVFCSYPPAIKEVAKAPDGTRHTWIWIFKPEKYIIVKLLPNVKMNKADNEVAWGLLGRTDETIERIKDTVEIRYY